ncbi:MAG: amidohydrolase family protein [Planctomycetes bacterium]|nr:amidohydrolase family protein [Planctomycetota bacterium]
MSTLGIQAIDVHGHYGDYVVEGTGPHASWCMTADGPTVAQRAKACNIQWTIVSPTLGLFPRGKADAVAGNAEAASVVPKTPGLLQYVIVNPLQPATYDQARLMLKNPTCVGIKLHPEEHRYPIREHGDKLYAFAAEFNAVILVHSGEQLSLPDDYIPFADAYPTTRTILAHIGCGWNGDRTLQARAVQKSKKGNVVTDTSSMMSMLPRNIEWTVEQVGADRVLFGTDTPLYSTPMQRARIDYAEIPDDQKRLILRDNALRLFGDKLRPHVS